MKTSGDWLRSDLSCWHIGVSHGSAQCSSSTVVQGWPYFLLLSLYHIFMRTFNQNKFQLMKLHCLESEIPAVHYHPVLSTAFPQVRLHNTYDTWILKLLLRLFMSSLKHWQNSHIYDKKENPEQGSPQNTHPHKTKLECWYSSTDIWKKSKIGFHIYPMSFWITIRKWYHISSSELTVVPVTFFFFWL